MPEIYIVIAQKNTHPYFRKQLNPSINILYIVFFEKCLFQHISTTQGRELSAHLPLFLLRRRVVVAALRFKTHLAAAAASGAARAAEALQI